MAVFAPDMSIAIVHAKCAQFPVGTGYDRLLFVAIFTKSFSARIPNTPTNVSSLRENSEAKPKLRARLPVTFTSGRLHYRDSSTWE